MTTNFLRERQRPQVTAEAMEMQLEAALNMLAPRPEFVERLRTRLTTEPDIILADRRNKGVAFIIATIGLFGGAFLVWLIFYLRSLFGRD